MGVNTKAILTKGTTIEQIEAVISNKFQDVQVHANSSGSMYITFKDGEHARTLYVSFANYCEHDYGIAGVWLCLGYWGNSFEILQDLCETFGGYLNKNDCDDEGFYPICYHLYSQGVGFTQTDEFRHKVIKEVGYEKLKSVLALFEEYQTKFSLVKQN